MSFWVKSMKKTEKTRLLMSHISTPIHQKYTPPCQTSNSIFTNFSVFIFLPYSRTEEAAKCLEATKLQSSTQFTQEFTVMESLMG